MRYQWLKQNNNNTSVIVLFSGWGFDQTVFTHLMVDDDEFDVLFVQDYRELDLPLLDLQQYEKRFLIAWSFGVASFSAWIIKHEQQSQHQETHYPKNSLAEFDKLIAINGTMHAVDRFLGIPNTIMQKTIDTLSQQSFAMFAKRCFIANELPNLNINVADKRQELEMILTREHFAIEGWDRVWISNRDKIFPTKNLINAWQAYNDKQEQLHRKTAELKYCDAPHAPFHLWSNWNEIISS